MRSSKRKRAISAATGVVALTAMAAILAGPIGGATAAPGTTDLQLTKSDSPDPVVEKTALAYTIQVKNLGGTAGMSDAENVVVTDNLPNGLTNVTATSASGTCNRANRTVTCNLGTLVEGATATVTIAVTAPGDGTISNTASVATSGTDSNPANNQDTESTTVSKAPTVPKTPKTKKPKKVKAQGCSSPSITGTAGNDTLVGTAGVDVIRGLAGDDTILSGAGNDIVCADFGSDVVSGGLGADTIIGGGGRDRLLGGGGGDILRGKSGPDKLRGQGGPDLLNGGSSTRDRCNGGGGRDVEVACP